jgi:acyl-CoA thioester hydrolase
MSAEVQPAGVPIYSAPAARRQTIQFRVRYSETDQMGTFYNSRPLEWFEMGRTELLRHLGLPYVELEHRGVFLPLIEARVEYLGRARYDDLLAMTTVLSAEGRARLRTDVEIVQAAGGQPVVRGHTVHAFTDRDGRAIRPPVWVRERLAAAGSSTPRTGAATKDSSS